jgi:hypothetical protein
MPAKLVAQLAERTRGRFVIRFGLLGAPSLQLLHAGQRTDVGGERACMSLEVGRVAGRERTIHGSDMLRRQPRDADKRV